MEIRKAFKFRLKLTFEQEHLCSQFGGMGRYVWNKGLALQKERIAQGLSCLGYVKLCAELTAWRNSKEGGFLSLGPNHTQQQKLKDLSRAIEDAFDREQPHKEFPVFKKKGKGRDSFRYPDKTQFSVDRNNNRAKLPKLGWVRWLKGSKCHGLRRRIEGEVQQVTIGRDGGQWYVSFSCLVHVDEPPVHPSKTAVGGDLGVKKFLALSDGTIFGPLNAGKKLARKLARAQQALARKKKFSQNWKKQQKKIARIHREIANRRHDHLHKVSAEISKNHAVIALEDLRVKNMSASAKGTADNPGKNVKQKAGLNRAILDQGWGMFARLVEYKQAWLGGQLLLVDPAYTSQGCAACGHVAKENRRTQSLFLCEACGHTKNADINAAENILQRAVGRTVLACGGRSPKSPAEAGTNLEAA